MKNLYKSTLSLLLVIAGFAAQAQVSFTNKNAKLSNSNFHSGCTVAIADWNFDGLDDIIRLDDGRIATVEVQRTNNTFQSIALGTFSTSSGWSWGMCVADLDHNGYLDIMAGGYGPAVRIIMTDANGAMGAIVDIPNSGFFVQNMTAADFNNDGWIDLFACDDNAQSHIFLNSGTGLLTQSPTTINFDVTTTDDSGNYGSVWTDFDNDGDMDLYIAKCRQGVNSPTDGRRINVMFVNDGNNNFTESAAAYGINIGWQSWTASFGDIDNDGDLDLLVTNHDYASQILENDGTGHYTDITSSTGFNISDITPIQSVMEDFDNDGFVDLFITGSNSRYYHNNGNKTFTRVDGLFNADRMESFAVGDLNHDGLIDIYGSYATIYTNPTTIDDVIWMNSTRNNNHFVTLNLIGTVSNKGAIGARANIYGSWGVQTREVRAGESYGTVNSSMLHFGLGSSNSIDSIVVNFPSGISQTILNPQADQFIRIVENDCVSPEPAVVYSQADHFICTGSTETLTAAPFYNYLWSNGSTTSSISITAGGEYNVIVSAPGNNCEAVSPTFVIEQDPDQTPVVTATGETEFCDGSSVDLVSTSYGISSFTWSNGAATPNTTATQSGTYTLTVQGYCAAFTSNPIAVTAHVVPAPVTATTVSLPAAGPATLNAIGSIINWYDSANAITPVYTGPSYVTPVITGTTDFWVENVEKYNAGVFNTGLYSPSGSNLYSSSGATNAKMYFDVAKACTLKTVKVFTNLSGTRRIELYNSQDVLLQYADAAITNVSPDSQIITLDFILSPGSDYYLTTDDSTNLAIPGWGNAGPKFIRNTVGVNYPYTISDALSITGNDFGSQYFYYFYDWSVEKQGLSCSSSRVQVTVDISTGVQDLSEAGIQLYPNPAGDVLQVKQTNNTPLIINIYDAAGRLVMKSNLQSVNNTVSLAGLSQGLYQVELVSAGSRYQQKLIKY
ncbi:MAG: VCBS repeat-containing protein [Bacteroidia bacterium]|nr:VCBS repeat-containing protein [Bacteroidia bacterium]